MTPTTKLFLQAVSTQEEEMFFSGRTCLWVWLWGRIKGEDKA